MFQRGPPTDVIQSPHETDATDQVAGGYACTYLSALAERPFLGRAESWGDGLAVAGPGAAARDGLAGRTLQGTCA